MRTTGTYLQGAPRTVKAGGPLGRTCPVCQAKPGHSCYTIPTGKEGSYARRLKKPHDERRDHTIRGRQPMLGKPFTQLAKTGAAHPGHAWD